MACVRDALHQWSDKTGRRVEWIEKGQNLLTEMYSALSAEVPVNAMTSFDYTLLDSVSFQNYILNIVEVVIHMIQYKPR